MGKGESQSGLSRKRPRRLSSSLKILSAAGVALRRAAEKLIVAGRVAVNAEQIDKLLAEAPAENVVLLRPDTVPEDIAIITRVNAILTARGGATSHAAVTAKRLGKTAVVDCRELEVIERQGSARLAGCELHFGDWLSVDGRTGNIFLGRIPTLTEPALPELD